MKQIINGKRYDTETATLVADISPDGYSRGDSRMANPSLPADFETAPACASRGDSIMYEIVEVGNVTYGRKVGTFWHCAVDTFDGACVEAEALAQYAGSRGGWFIVRPCADEPGPTHHAYF